MLLSLYGLDDSPGLYNLFQRKKKEEKLPSLFHCANITDSQTRQECMMKENHRPMSFMKIEMILYDGKTLDIH